MNKPTIMAVDGNSLLHRAYHALAGTNMRDPWGRPTWAVKGMLSLLTAAVDRVGPDALVVGFDSSGDSVRKARFPDYKATRSEKHEDLVAQLKLAPDMLAYAGIAVRVVPGLEADDVTATAARLAGEHGWHAVIVTSDRDAFAHISDHCSVLRIINGGVENSPLLTPEKLVTMTGIRGEQYLDYAALRGDTSDNLTGVRGIGEKTAAKLLTEFGTMDAVWHDIDHNKGARVAGVGKAVLTKLCAEDAKAAWARNIEIMSAVTDLDLGVDLAGRTGDGILPVAAERLEEACRVVNIDPRALVGALGRPRTAAPSAPVPTPPAPVVAMAGPPDSGPVWHDEPPYDPDYDTPVPAAAGTRVEATPTGQHPAALVELLF